MNSSSSINSSSWVIQIRGFFEAPEDEIESDNNTHNVCVYNVPKSLRTFKPEAYSPQTIALGPYHHLREDLYEMETYKLLCAKMVRKELKTLKFDEDLVKKLLKKEHTIRGCYDKFLEMEGEALAWMMVIDGLFLLEFLHIYVNKNKNISLASSESRISFWGNSIGTKLSYISILNDILMLENQIPVLVLKKILRVQCSDSDMVDNLLGTMLISVCKEVSPVKLKENYHNSEVKKRAHLLDLLYHLMVPKLEQVEDQEVSQGELLEEAQNEVCNEEDLAKSFEENQEVVLNTWNRLKSMFAKLKIFKLLGNLPIRHIMNLPIFSALGSLLESMLVGDKKDSKTREGSSGKEDEQTVLVEEIMIPSVSDLFDAGVDFRPSNGDISSLRFDKKLRIFYLPVIRVDGNTEVLMRNLVAFEASDSTHLVLARFCELMNGIIDTAKDVEILRKKRVLTSSLRKDEEVANLWNGMTKAIRLSRVDFIDEAIKGVNGYYNNTFKKKFQKLMRRYVYNSWRILVVLATLVFLGLMMIQSFCSVYSCPRLFNIDVGSISSSTLE